MTPTTPEQARELADTRIHASPIACALRSLADQVEALTTESNETRQKLMESDLMAECTTMLRSDLIEAGIVDKTVPPMMLTESIMRHIQTLKAECVAADKLIRENLAERDSLRAELQIKSAECDLFQRGCDIRDAALDQLKKQEPVEYQLLILGERWTHCTKFLYDKSSDRTIVRALYIAPGAQPAEIEALRADEERSETCPECFSRDCNGECSGDGAMGD